MGGSESKVVRITQQNYRVEIETKTCRSTNKKKKNNKRRKEKKKEKEKKNFANKQTTAYKRGIEHSYI